MLGLFVQNHAKAAVRGGNKVTVAYATSTNEAVHPHTSINLTEGDQLVEIIVYYNANKPFSFISQLIAWYKAIKAAHRQSGKPDLIHAHILTRVGFIAWVCSKWYKVPYIITEHWSRYYPENLRFKGGFLKFLTRFVINKASAVTVVSKRLFSSMHQAGLNFDLNILPNVVDTNLFHPLEHINARYKFVNISCFEDRSKNLKLLIEAAEMLYSKFEDFELELIGDGMDKPAIEQYAKTRGIRFPLYFTGTLTPAEVSKHLQKADSLVLSSNYETFAIVVFEALASGVPVVTTNVADLEHIITKEYGIVVPVGNVEALANGMHNMIRNRQKYNSTTLRELVFNTYSMDSVSEKLAQLYQRVIK